MYCRKCGASIPDDAEFCTECGQSRTSTVINSIDMDKTANINASTTQLKLKNILNELNKKEKNYSDCCRIIYYNCYLLNHGWSL